MKKTRYFSLEEVKQHSSKGDCWVVINQKVYDLSRWIRYHPGGDLPILYMAGRDCTDVFRAFHLPSVFEKKLPAFKIGEIEGAGRKEAKKQTYLEKDFGRIREEMETHLDTNCKLTFCGYSAVLAEVKKRFSHIDLNCVLFFDASKLETENA